MCMFTDDELEKEYVFLRKKCRDIIDKKLDENETYVYDDLVDAADDLIDEYKDRLHNCEELLNTVVSKLIDYESFETKDEIKLIKELHALMLRYAVHKYMY